MGFSGKWWEVVQDTNAFATKRPARCTAARESWLYFHKPSRKVPLAHRNSPDWREPVGRYQAIGYPFSDPQVSVKELVKNDPTEVVLRVEVGNEAAVGPVRLEVKGVPCKDQLKVFDTIHGIRILPALGRARVSCGPAYPPHGVQFVAVRSITDRTVRQTPVTT